jgi:hypothetical protein
MQVNPLSLSLAISLGDGLYEIVLSNWGNRGTSQDPDNGSIMFPSLKTLSNGNIPLNGPFYEPSGGVGSIIIAPKSDADRFALFFNNHVPDAPGASALGFLNRGEIPLMNQIISIDTPIVAPINGPLVIRAHPAGWWADTYTPCGLGPVTAPFGPSLGNPPVGSTGGPIFINPALRVLLSIAGQRFLPSDARAPLHHEYAYAFATTNKEQLTKAIQIIGRKFVRVLVQAASGGAPSTVTVQLTGLFTHIGTGPNPVTPTIDLIEVPLAGPVVLNAAINDCAILTAPEAPCANFLLVKATASALPATATVSICGRD